ncbi:MAG TPA: TonB-dependent receptor [Terricaulis sp.]|nr:TonB-dependent receptor [Terricaulis sp.]
MSKHAVLLGAITVIAFNAGGAHAQNVASTNMIVVTATREAALARDLPQSVAVISGDALRAADGAEDLVMLLPGVQAAISNGSQTTFQIRGVGAVDHQALTPSAAAVHVDGVFLATNVQASLLAYDLARVEVLKGPQGTIQGRNASSGSINFISAPPSATPEAYLEASYGRFDRIDVQAAASGALTAQINGRIAARYLAQDAALENVGGPKDAGGVRDEYGVRVSFAFDLGADRALLLRGHVEADNGINPAPLNSSLTLGDHQISVGADGVQDTNNDFHGLSAQYNARIGAWRFTSLTAAEGFRQRYGFDFDGMPASLANLSYDRDYLQLSQDAFARTQWRGGALLLGAAFSYDDFSQDYLIWCGALDTETLAGTCTYPGAPARVGPSPASPTPAVSLLTHIEQTRRAGALYAVADFDIGANTTLTLGGRQTLERISGQGFGQHIYADGVRALNNRDGVGLAEGRNTIDESRFTGMAALRHRLGPDAMIYASFGQGYKSGGFNGEVANNATHYQDEGLFRAETVNAYEIGYKGALGAALSLEAALFYQDYERPQARVFVAFPLPGGGSITSNSLSNLDAARVQGIDLSATWRPWAGAEISGGVVALDSEIAQGGVNAATLDGNPLPFASDVSATLTVQQNWDRLSFEASAKYQSAYYLDPEGRADRRQGGFTLVNAALRYALSDSAEISLWGRNLTNEDYALSGYGFIGYDTFRSQPAMWGVSVRFTR